jgi:hypothetical protein
MDAQWILLSAEVTSLGKTRGIFKGHNSPYQDMLTEYADTIPMCKGKTSVRESACHK